MRNHTADDEILGGEKAAELLGIEVRTLADWRKRRGLPHLRITAKEIRYRKRDLLAWLDGFRQGVVR